MNKKMHKIERKLFEGSLRETGCVLTTKEVKKLLVYIYDLEDKGYERLHDEVLRTAGQNVMLNLAVSAWAGVAKRLADVLKAINDAKLIISGLDDDLIIAVLKDYETMTAESGEK